MKRCIYIVVLIIGLVTSLSAQKKHLITGYIISRDDSTALVNAYVQLEDAKQVLAQALSAENGYFELPAMPNAEKISIRYMGNHHNISISRTETSLSLGKIYLSRPNQTLTAVEVRAQRPFVRYDAGRSIYNLEASPFNLGSSLLEALGRIPNLQYQAGRGLLLNGFESVTVLLDKRPLRISRAELENYLASIPSSDIASVEVVYSPGAEYNSNSGPIVHIISKRHLEDGYNAYMATRGNWQYHLGAQANARLSLNKGISRSHISYSYAHERSRETTDLGPWGTTQTEVLPRNRHQLALGSLLRLNKRHTLDANLYSNWSSERFRYGRGLGYNMQRPSLFSSIQHNYTSNQLELRTTLEGGWASLHQSNLVDDAITLKDRSHTLRINPIISYRPSEALRLTAGGSYEYSTYHNDYLSAGSIYDLREHQATVFSGLTLRLGALQLQGQLSSVFYTPKSSESTLRQGKTETILLPRLVFGYSLSPQHYLTAELKSNYTRPDYRDLSPYRTQSAERWQREGNTTLSSSRNYSYALRYSFMQAAILELSYSDTHAPIVEYIRQKPGERSLNFSKLNLDYSRYTRALVVLPIPLSRRDKFSWLATTTAAWQRQWDRGELEGTFYSQSFSTYYLQHRQEFAWNSAWTLSMSYTRYGSLYYGLYKMQPTDWVELDIARKLGAWRLGLNLRDPWNSNTARGSYTIQGQSIDFVRNWHRPQLSISISYSLGNQTLKRYSERARSNATNRMRREANEGMARGVGQQ